MTDYLAAAMAVLSAWLAGARRKYRSGQLPKTHGRPVAAGLDGGWTAEDAVLAVLM